MSQDLDTQHFGDPSEPGAPGHKKWLGEQRSDILTCKVCGQEFLALDGVTGVEHPRPGDDGRHSWVWAPLTDHTNGSQT